jgi:ABC-type sugar transport system permease subunit
MTRENITASQALKQAEEALRQGDKQAARHWAQAAVSMAPNTEDPWLIMAAVANPRASIAYLERALEIDPESVRARKGLEWARARPAWEQPQPVRRAAISHPGAAETPTQPLSAIQQIQTASTITAIQPTTRAGKTRRQHVARDKRLWGLLLISPWLIGLVIFKLAPLLTTLGISFTDMFFLEPGKMSFVGIKNYIDMLRDPNLWTAFGSTFRLAGIVIPLQTATAILLAALLSDEKLCMKDTLRVLFFLPSIIPSAAAMFMFQGFVDPVSGWLNPLLLNPLGLVKYVHFSTWGYSPSLLVLTTFWSIGPGFLIIVGAMQGIPTDIFEAALVDGANRLRRFFFITLPMVSPAILFTLILNLTALFGGAILLDRGYNFNSNLSTVDNFLYFVLFDSFRLGAASSLAWIFFIFLMVVVLVLFASSKIWVYFPDQEN